MQVSESNAAGGRDGTAKPTLVVMLLLAVITLAVFWQVPRFEYTNLDDHEYISENSLVQRGLSAENIRWAFKDTHLGNWHPLTWLSLMTVVELFGPGPAPQHVLNLILHMINALLLFVIMREMTGEIALSAAVSALFAVHPLHVESVAWVSERKGVLSASFFMLALLAYVAYARRPSILKYSFVAGAYLLGVLSKPIVITLPALLLLLDYWPLQRITFRKGHPEEVHGGFSKGSPRRVLVEKAPLLLMAIVFSAATFFAQQKAGAVSTLESFPVGSRAIMALSAYSWYLGKMVVPSHLAAFYPVPESIAPWKTALDLAIFFGISALAILRARQMPYLLTGWMWYVVALLPVSGLITVGSQFMADRYSYISLVGPFIAVVWGGWALAGQNRIRRKVAALMAVAVVFVFICVSHVQTKYWRNSLLLHSRSVAATEENWVAHYALGKYYGDIGKYDEAMESYQKAIRIKPSYPDSYMPLCLLYLGRGDVQSAMSLYRQLEKYDAAAASKMLTFIRYAAGR